VEGLHIK